MDIRTLPIFNTVRVGNVSSFRFKEEFALKGMYYDCFIRKVIERGGLTVSKEVRDIDLVLLQGVDLFSYPEALYEEVCEYAVSYGLELCTLEMALLLRLQYESLKNERINIATIPFFNRYIPQLECSTGTVLVGGGHGSEFDIDMGCPLASRKDAEPPIRLKTQTLRSCYHEVLHVVSPDTKLVFVKPHT